MTIAEARQLKAGDKIRFDTGKNPKEKFSDPPCDGTVETVQRSWIGILWEREPYAGTVNISDDPGCAEWWGNIHKL